MASEPPPPSFPWRLFTGFLAVLAGSRIACGIFLYLFAGGREISDDVDMHMAMVRAPFTVLSGASEHAQHPPLLPIMESIIAWPLQLFAPSFVAIRATYGFYELVLGALFFLVLRQRQFGAQRTRWLLAAFIVAPIGWMTSVVMPQDEVIAACFLMAVLLFALRKQDAAALCVAGVGLVAGKLFLIVPLLFLVVGSKERNVFWRAAWGLCVPVTVYAIVWFNSRGNSGVLGFTPEAAFGVNMWVLLGPAFDVATATAKWTSAGLSGLAALISVSVVYIARTRRSLPINAPVAVYLSLIVFLWVWLIFYHVNPEYYILSVPFLLLSARSPAIIWSVIVLSGLPWAVNFLFGVSNAMHSGHGGGKATFVKLYTSVTSFPPSTFFTMAVVATSLATLSFAVIETRRLCLTDTGK